MQVYGIDLSMEKFDVNYIDQKGMETTKVVKNNLRGISKFLSKIPQDAVLCAEHTGVYGDLLVFLSNQHGLRISLVPGYTIKHSLGMIKGKSDAMDAHRIREYGERFQDQLTFNTYDPEAIGELKALYALRCQLVKARKLLLNGRHSRGKAPMQSIQTYRITQQTISELESRIQAVESEIVYIITSDQQLNENYQLVTSITGLGPVITTDLIIKTGNFKTIDTARKASSYAGVCPFPNESGKMARKSKTSRFGDRRLKSLLYMGARAAAKHNKEYRLYYLKKKLEGKHHFLIMNNISNKLLRTVYSVVHNKTPYCPNFICLDPRERNLRSTEEKVA